MKTKPRAPLSPAEREAIGKSVLHLLREALRDDFTVYTNRADYAQAFGILEGLVKVGLISEQGASDWRHNLETEAETGDPEVISTVEPIHDWFGLTYSAYLVLPRVLLQSMPNHWQRLFVRLIREMQEAFENVEQADIYEVRCRDENGRFAADPLPGYERGRERVPVKEGFRL